MSNATWRASNLISMFTVENQAIYVNYFVLGGFEYSDDGLSIDLITTHQNTHLLCLLALKQAQWHEHIDVLSPVTDMISWPIWPLNIESFAVITSPSSVTLPWSACKIEQNAIKCSMNTFEIWSIPYLHCLSFVSSFIFRIHCDKSKN